MPPLVPQADAVKTKYLNDQGISTVREFHYTEDYTGDQVPEAYRGRWAPRNIINDLPPGGRDQGTRFMLPSIMAEYGDHGRPEVEFLNRIEYATYRPATGWLLDCP